MNPAIPQNSTEWFSRLAWLGALLAIIGLAASNALISIGTVLMALPILQLFIDKKILQKYKENKSIWFFAVIYILHLLSFFYIESTERWLHHIWLKLPLLIIPLGLNALAPFTKKQTTLLLWTLLLSIIIVALVSSFKYLLNMDAVNLQVLQSQEIKIISGRNHIYFSILLAMAIFSGIWIYLEADEFYLKVEKPVALGLAILGFILLHILSARTGIVAFYVTSFFIGLKYFISQKKYLYAVVFLSMITILPIVGYQFIPSFQNRIDNTVDDVRRYVNDEYRNYYSISMRLEAWEIGFKLFKKNPVRGCGISDIKEKMRTEYELSGSAMFEENRLQPHNQFVEYLAGFGLIGLILLVGGLTYPLFNIRYRNSFLFLSFWLIVISSMNAESLLERQAGVVFISMFWLLLPSPKESQQELI